MAQKSDQLLMLVVCVADALIANDMVWIDRRGRLRIGGGFNPTITDTDRDVLMQEVLDGNDMDPTDIPEVVRRYGANATILNVANLLFNIQSVALRQVIKDMIVDGNLDIRRQDPAIGLNVGDYHRSEPKSLDVAIGGGQNDVYYEEHIEYKGHKYRIDIRSNSYGFQSHAKLYSFANDQRSWNSVTSIHYASMKTETGLVHRPEFHRMPYGAGVKGFFSEDRDELIRKLRLIVD